MQKMTLKTLRTLKWRQTDAAGAIDVSVDTWEIEARKNKFLNQTSSTTTFGVSIDIIFTRHLRFNLNQEKNFMNR